VICTRDRADALAALLRGLPDQALSKATAWEIIVVDNGSKDHTERVLREAARTSPIPLRALSQPEAGLSAARNRGWRAAEGRLIAFLDDDSTPEPGWLQALLDSFAAPEVTAVAGRLLPQVTGGRADEIDPNWLAIYTFDHGDAPREIRELTGANMSFRRSFLVEAGGLDERLGRIGDCLLAGDDNDLCHAVQRTPGAKHILYQPGALAHHRLQPSTLTDALLLKRSYCGGISNAVLDRKTSAAEQLTRAARRALAMLFWGGRTLAARINSSQRQQLQLAARREEFSGYVKERTGGVTRACRGCPMRPLRAGRIASLEGALPHPEPR
jgi:GT2 family glycosyltransferase